jgi:hypothetical protein
MAKETRSKIINILDRVRSNEIQPEVAYDEIEKIIKKYYVTKKYLSWVTREYQKMREIK